MTTDAALRDAAEKTITPERLAEVRSIAEAMKRASPDWSDRVSDHLTALADALTAKTAECERLREALEVAERDLTATYDTLKMHGRAEISIGQFGRLRLIRECIALSTKEAGHGG